MNSSNTQPVSKMNDSVIRTMFFALLPAQILAIASGSLGNIVSTFLVGNHLPPIALSVIGFVVPLNTFLAAISSIVSGGARILCGKSMGRGDVEAQKKILSSSVFLLTIVGILFLFFGYFFTKGLVLLLGAKGDLMAPASEYIRGLLPGFLPTLLLPCLLIFLQMNNDSSFSVLVAFLLAAFSLAFGLINLYFFQGSLLGMGLADSVAKWMTLIIIGIRFKAKKLQKLTWRMLSSKTLLHMIWIGLPPALSSIFYALRNTFLNKIIIQHFGEQALASFTIMLSSMGPFDALKCGFGSVCLMLCSLYSGMKDRSSMKTIIRLTMKMGLMITAAASVAVAVSAKPIAVFFGASGTLADAAARVIRIYAYSFPFNIFLQAFVSAYQCLGRIRFINVFYLFSAFLIPVSYVWLSVPLLGMDAVNSCFGVADILSTVIFYLAGLCMNKQSFLVEEMVSLPRDEGQYLNFSIASIDEAVSAATTVRSYCEKNGIDKLRSYYCGLCVEEIAVNSVAHGFRKTKNKKNLSVDIFLQISHEEITLRICDNCVHFNPLEHIAPENEQEKEKYMGIRLVRSVADEFSYQSTFGQNLISISWKNHGEGMAVEKGIR